MYLDTLDIANRACQLLGAQQINSPTEDSVQNQEISFAYDKVRRAELRRNVWRFATRRTILRPLSLTTMMLSPSAWNATTLYLLGAIVKDSNGILWISAIPENINNEPGVTAAWEQFFGPMAVDSWVASLSYFAGELVYKSVGNPGSYVIFQSLVNGNADTPTVATAWGSTIQYGLDATVTFGGSQWRSLIPFNVGITPAAGPAVWSAAVSYSVAQQAVGSDGYIYSSITSANAGNDPTIDGGVHWTNTTVANAWSNVPALYPSSTKWLPIYAALSPLNILYPIGTGPSSQNVTRNVFRLPSNFLREAPQDPKAGSTSALGAPTELAYTDWQLEGNLISSWQTNAIPYRFVADIVTVTKFDDMFCEGLAQRIAVATCERITNSTSKVQLIEAMYKTTMGDARTVNGIETGSVEPPLDDLLAVRA